jgi:membrane-bound inhibitor of C-type lysozyme
MTTASPSHFFTDLFNSAKDFIEVSPQLTEAVGYLKEVSRVTAEHPQIATVVTAALTATGVSALVSKTFDPKMTAEEKAARTKRNTVAIIISTIAMQALFAPEDTFQNFGVVCAASGALVFNETVLSSLKSRIVNWTKGETARVARHQAFSQATLAAITLGSFKIANNLLSQVVPRFSFSIVDHGAILARWVASSVIALHVFSFNKMIAGRQ